MDDPLSALALVLEKKDAHGESPSLVRSEREKIPTTFVNLAPEKIVLDLIGIDLLGGVFHIMWSDMPARRTYGIRLADHYTSDGSSIGSSLVCTFPRERIIAL
jgi:hypothetical protein